MKVRLRKHVSGKIDAVQFTEKGLSEQPEWITKRIAKGHIVPVQTSAGFNGLKVSTSTGPVLVFPGDYIVMIDFTIVVLCGWIFEALFIEDSKSEFYDPKQLENVTAIVEK